MGAFVGGEALPAADEALVGAGGDEVASFEVAVEAADDADRLVAGGRGAGVVDGEVLHVHLARLPEEVSGPGRIRGEHFAVAVDGFVGEVSGGLGVGAGHERFDQPPTRLAIARLDLAQAHAALGEPDAALMTAREALAGDRIVSSMRGRARQLDHQLRRRYPTLPDAIVFSHEL